MYKSSQNPSALASSTPVLETDTEQTFAVIRDLPPPGATPAQQEPAGDAAATPLPPIAVFPPKSLDDSDDSARKVAKQLSEPLLVWLTPDEQVRKWVLLVNNLSNAKMPIKNRPMRFPFSPFEVSTSAGDKRLSSSNYSRGSAIVNALVSIDVALLYRYYEAWSPLLEKAQRELGQADSVEQSLLGALDQILAVDPDAATNAKLERPSVYYKYADPELESASDLEKFFWRLGPDNTRKLQQFAQQLKAQFESDLVDQDRSQKPGQGG